MTLEYGAALCAGAKSAVNPARPALPCVACLRRLTPAVHPWQKWLEPAPAVHQGGTWSCGERVTS